MVNKKSRGSARTGQTQRNYQQYRPGRRFSEKKMGFVTKTTRLSENEFSKQKGEELFDDGGLPCGISLSLNKKNRWMIPEIVEEEIAERCLQSQQNDGQIKNQERKATSRSPKKEKKKKSQNHADELPLKSIVIERNLLSHSTICKAVYSATSEECKIKKGKSWKCQLSALKEDPANDYDLLYEIESGTPSETWPFNCESSFFVHNSLLRKQLDSKSSSYRAMQLEMKEALNEWYGSFENENYIDGDEPHEADIDQCSEFENNDREIVTLADFCIPKKESVKRKTPTASSRCSFDKLKPCNPASTELAYLHEKNTMIYVESDGVASPVVKEENNNNETQETTLDTNALMNKKDAGAIRDDGLKTLTPKANNDMNGFLLRGCQECKISVGTASISEKQLLEIYGNDYIESKSTPRTFAIILDQTLLDGESSNNKCFIVVENIRRNDSQATADLACKIFGYKRDIREILRGINENHRRLNFGTLTQAMLQSHTVGLSPHIVSHKCSHLESSLFQELTKWRPRSMKITEACDLLLNELFTAAPAEETFSCDGAPLDLHAATYTCGICYELMPLYKGESGNSNETRLKECLHTYCKRCWDSYLVSKINESALDIKCPTLGCQAVVDMVTMISIVSPNNALKHLKASLEGKIAECKEWEWCPSCEQAAFCPGFHNAKLQTRVADLPVVQCACLKRWCFHCKEVCHWPARCDDIAKYERELKRDIGTLYDHNGKLYITDVSVKRCPKCLTHIEKFHGCNSMVCRCGINFCWHCLQVFSGYKHPSNCLEVKATKVEFTSLDSFFEGNGKIIRKAHKFRYLADQLKRRKTKLGLEKPSKCHDKIHLLQPKERLIKEAIEFHKEACKICENLALTRLGSTSKYYNRRLFRFIDSAEVMLKGLMDTVTQQSVDLVDMEHLTLAMRALKTHILGVKRIGS